MARQFKGYAQKKGFAAPDPGYASLSRMKERDNETIRRIQERHNQEQARDANYISDLQQANQIEKSNRDENFAFSQKLDQNRRDQEEFVEKQRRDKAEQQLKKINDEALAAAQARKDLGAFSKKLLDLGTKVLEERVVAKEQAEEVMAILKGPLELLAPDEETEQKLDETYVAGEAARREAGLNGVSQGTVQSARNASPYLAIGNLNVRMRGAIAELQGMNALSDFKFQVADIMKKYGLHGVKLNKLHDFAIATRTQISALQAKYDQNLAINQSQQVEQQVLQDITSTRSSDSIIRYFNASLGGTDDGVMPRTRSQAWDKVWNDESIFSNSSIISAPEYERMLDAKIPGLNQTIRERFPLKVEKQYAARINSEKTYRNLILQETQNVQNKNFDTLKQAILSTKEGFDFEKVKQELRVADVDDTQQATLQELAFDRSKQGIVQDSLIESIEYKWRNGIDVSEDVRMLRGDIRQTWEAKVVNQAKAFNESGQNPTELKKKYTAILRNKLSTDKIVAADQSYVTAGEEAYRRYVGYFNSFLTDNKTAAQAHRDAEELLLKEMASSEGDFVTVEDLNQAASFPYFSIGGGYYKTNQTQVLTGKQLSKEIQDDREVLSRKLVMPEETAVNIYNSIKEGRPYRMPYQLATLEANGSDVSHLVQKQMDVLTKKNPEAYPSIEVPKSFKEVVTTSTPDTRVKRLSQIIHQQNATAHQQLSLLTNTQNYRRAAFMAPRVSQAYNFQRNNAVMTPLRELTMSGEGGFDSANRGRAGDSPGGIPGLERKTIGEWKQLYSQGWNALGAFQFIGSTFDGAVSRLGLSDDTVMSQETQFQLFDELILGGVKRPRLTAYLNGESNDLTAAAEDFSLEFASVANPRTGITSYPGVGGNAASISSNSVMDILKQIRAHRMAN